MDKSHMFWSDTMTYGDGEPIPRVTYRCRGAATKGEGLTARRHECKRVTDHEGACKCICGLAFGEQVAA